MPVFDAQAELVEKLETLLDETYDGDLHVMFMHYSVEGRIDGEGLLEVLKDAGIGNWFTRPLWVKGIMDAVDVDRDEKISEEELKAAIEAG